MIELDNDKRSENLLAANQARRLKIQSITLQRDLFEIEEDRRDLNPGHGMLPGDAQVRVRNRVSGEVFVVIDKRTIPPQLLGADIERQLDSHS